MQTKTFTVEDFYAFKIKNMWSYFKGQHFSFWMICCYLFFEFVKPQSLIPQLDVLPWAKVFLLGAMAGAVVDASVKKVTSPANMLITLFLISLCISIAAAIYRDISIDSFMLFFGWYIIYFLIIKIVNTPNRLYVFLMIYIFAAGKIAIGTSKNWIMRGFSFQDWGLVGPAGFFQNSGELAILMLMLFPLVFYLYKCLKDKVSTWEKWLLIAFWVCPILTILGSSSRGAQLALAVQLIIMFRKSVFRIKPLLGVLILSSLLYSLLPDEQKNRFTEAGDDKTSQQRLLYWKHGWQMMKEYPLTGVGFFNFIPYYEQFYAEDMLYPRAQLPHNIFIQVGTDAGFGALFIFISLILYAIILSWRLKEKKHNTELTAIAAGLGMGVLGFVIAGQFVTVTYYPFFWIHLALLVALSNVIRSKDVNNLFGRSIF